jgi:hypothetical protein
MWGQVHYFAQRFLHKTWGQVHGFTPNPVNLSLYCRAGSLSQGDCQSFRTRNNRSGLG